MSSNKPNFPSIPENEHTPLIDMLLESSKMDEKTEDDNYSDRGGYLGDRK